MLMGSLILWPVTAGLGPCIIAPGPADGPVVDLNKHKDELLQHFQPQHATMWSVPNQLAICGELELKAPARAWCSANGICVQIRPKPGLKTAATGLGNPATLTKHLSHDAWNTQTTTVTHKTQRDSWNSSHNGVQVWPGMWNNQ
jgi:hypothetical protein